MLRAPPLLSDVRHPSKQRTSENRILFLALILTQAGHSIEEYSTRLYDVLAPARFVSSFFSDDRSIGFAIFNA